MTATEQVILVDEYDNPIGTAEKLKAHQENLCHRAFSVFIFKKGPKLAILLQQRARHKYHSPLLWTNTCCSHPRPGEEIIQAGQRRLKEEMGLEANLRSLGHFHYIAHFNNGLTENEVDHVLVGEYNGQEIAINPDEVEDYRWVTLPELKVELKTQPERFTPWLEKALQVIENSGIPI
ncbi:MAG: isopentenyl-diphosphate Delta-isomerase [Gammaproteobacteria bacterium]